MNNEAPGTAPQLIDGPDVAAATVLLADLQPPTLILQGERDTFGRPEEVATTASSPPAAPASARSRTWPRRWPVATPS
jgi:hypothetical protein